MKELYYETRPADGNMKRKKGQSEGQDAYWAFMKEEMGKLAKSGVQGGERMKLAAEEWKKKRSQSSNGSAGSAVEAKKDEKKDEKMKKDEKKEEKEPEKVEAPMKPPVWIRFKGDTDPVQLDKLSFLQEIELKKGTPYEYVEAPEQ